MKNSRIVIFITILILALIISFFAVCFIVSSDKIIKSGSTIIAKTTLFTHETEKGENINLSFSKNVDIIGDEMYMINIFFTDEQSSTNYNIKNSKLEFSVNDSVDILMSFYSAGGSEYQIPQINYPEGRKVIQCFSDNGYVHLKLLLSGREAENSDLTVEYDIRGKGFYSFNKFHDFKEKINLSFTDK